MPPRVGRFRGIAATPATRWRGAQVTRPKLGRPEQWPSNAETSGVNAVMRKGLSPALDAAPVGLAVDRGLRQQDRHVAVDYREALGLGAAGAGALDPRRTAPAGVAWGGRAACRGRRQQDRHGAVDYREARGLGAAGAGDIDQRRTAHDGVDWGAAEAERDGVRGLDQIGRGAC